MKPIPLKPLLVREKRQPTPQCCVAVDPPTHNPVWRRDRYKKLRPTYDPERCQRESSFTINDQPYCRAHAADLALDKWLANELIEP